MDNFIYKLKFSNNTQADAVLNQEMFASWQVETVVVIGTITKSATVDEQGNELEPATVIEGWHVDVLAHTLIQELKDFVPSTPPSNPVHGYGWVEGQKFVVVTKQDYL